MTKYLARECAPAVRVNAICPGTVQEGGTLKVPSWEKLLPLTALGRVGDPDELACAARRVGKSGDHLQLHIRQGNATMKAIAFGAGELFDRLQSGVKIDLAFEPTLNTYNGYTNVELDVKDVQFPE